MAAMASLWAGDTAHVDLRSHGANFCVELRGDRVASRAYRDDFLS